MNNTLPTLNILHERYPSIVTNFLCLFCNKNRESLNHLTECYQLRGKWHTIIAEILNYTIDKVKQVLDISLSKRYMQYLLLQQFESFSPNDIRSNLCIDVLRGFILQDHNKLSKLEKAKLGKRIN